MRGPPAEVEVEVEAEDLAPAEAPPRCGPFSHDAVVVTACCFALSSSEGLGLFAQWWARSGRPDYAAIVDRSLSAGSDLGWAVTFSALPVLVVGWYVALRLLAAAPSWWAGSDGGAR